MQKFNIYLIDNTPTYWAKRNVNYFIEIDSMKLMGTYENYVENLDVGMMKESIANIHQKIIIDSNNYILLWSIYYSTDEACPYASGTIVFGTYFNNNVAQNTATLGEDSGGGDSPYWASTFITSEITTTSITKYKREVEKEGMDEETDEEIIEITDNTFLITITDSGFVVVDNK